MRTSACVFNVEAGPVGALDGGERRHAAEMGGQRKSVEFPDSGRRVGNARGEQCQRESQVRQSAEPRQHDGLIVPGFSTEPRHHVAARRVFASRVLDLLERLHRARQIAGEESTRRP